MFDALSARFAKTFGGLRGKGKISSSDIERDEFISKDISYSPKGLISI